MLPTTGKTESIRYDSASRRPAAARVLGENRTRDTVLCGVVLCSALLCHTALRGQPPTASTAAQPTFADVTLAWGIDFSHHHGGSGKRFMVETMVGGVVMFDYDGDGDEDLFFVDGGELPGYQGEAALSRLFRNDGDGRFSDRTESAGLEIDGYGCGGAAADYDDDGDLDLYITAFGSNRLFRNAGDGSFEEVAEQAGVADPLWSASAGFSDVDRDGDLDLYVANYVDFGLDNNKACGRGEEGVPGYCHPGAYNGLPDQFYRNLGDGRFREETAAAGFSAPHEAGLGVVFGDIDDDGWPDLYVANDADPNFLFRNQGDGSFEDLSLLSGTSYSDAGSPEAGMGVDMGDVDGDGKLDIVVTNFELETNALYKNAGSGLFVDSRFVSNLAEPSLLHLAFGVDLGDYDQDGDLDVVIANGHILDNAAEMDGKSRYAQPNQLMENLGGGRFREVAGSGLEQELVSRGLASGDLDGDGDLDLAILNSNTPASIYENVRTVGGWMLADFRGSESNHFGVDARVVAEVGGKKLLREVRTVSSYLSQGSLTLHFGVGDTTEIAGLSVRWSSGARALYRELPVSRRVLFFE